MTGPIKPALAHDPIDGHIRYDPDDSRPLYIGLHLDRNKDSASTDWTIFRFTYTTTTSQKVTNIEKRTLAWSARSVGW